MVGLQFYSANFAPHLLDALQFQSKDSCLDGVSCTFALQTMGGSCGCQADSC